MTNEINIIKPYRFETAWVFDDERVGLEREPFICGADALIDAALAESGMPDVQSFLLLFSAAPFPGATVTLEWRRAEMDGNVYGWNEREGWLCPALLLYFPTAPQRLHVQVRRAR